MCSSDLLIPLFNRSGKANLGHALETCVMLELERRGAVDIPAEITLDAAWNWLLQGNASV